MEERKVLRVRILLPMHAGVAEVHDALLDLANEIIENPKLLSETYRDALGYDNDLGAIAQLRLRQEQ